MRIQESENVVNEIREATGKIDDDTVLRNFLRTLFPIYAIRVSTIQELRCRLGNDLTLEGLVGRLTTFELSNFDNYKTKNIESDFKAKLSLKEPNGKKKKNLKYVSSDSDTNKEDVDRLEALLERRFHRGKGYFKCKLPIMCFKFNEVGHIAARCPEKKNYRGGNKYKRRRDEDKKEYKDKGKRSCYIAEEETKDASKDHDDEVVYVVMKDESDEDEATVLVSCTNKNDRWIIDSGCSHHMTRDKSKFITLNYCDGNSVRFCNDTPCLIKGKGSIKLTEKILCDHAYYVECVTTK